VKNPGMVLLGILWAHFKDECASLFVALVSIPLPAYVLSALVIPLRDYPAWTFQEWARIQLAVYFLFRIWYNLRRAAR
jgi:hypothetical protein